MAVSVSAAGRNPLYDLVGPFNKDFRKTITNEDVDNAVREAAPILANELDRLFPNTNLGFNDAGLRQMANKGYVFYNGKEHRVSEEARQAAQKILDVGGLSRINPNDKSGSTSAAEFKEILRDGVKHPTVPGVAAHWKLTPHP